MNDSYVFAPPTQPAVAVDGRTERFPVHRIYCVGRNYAAHAREMGMRTGKEAPFFFSKPADAEQPDFLVNTGDFVSYGWREFGRFDTLLKDAKSRYGSFAALGNHDFGAYHPFFTESDKDNNVMLMEKLISSSGYIILDNESAIVTVENSDVAFTGVETRGSFPKIIHSDPVTASAGTDSADLKILLAHDPNQWKKDVTGKTGFSITLSGHTHGMQMGILSKKLKWSPAKMGEVAHAVTPELVEPGAGRPAVR